jgi:hypothetical protein
MRCPRDADTLAEISFGVTMAVRCPTCRGVWGDMAALEALAQGPVVTRATSVSLDAHGDATGAIPCPGCAGPLGGGEEALLIYSGGLGVTLVHGPPWSEPGRRVRRPASPAAARRGA